MFNSLQRTAAAFLLAFFLLALALGRWSVASPDLVTRDDNPRRVFEEQLIQRGSIFDRNDQVLAETAPQSGTLARRYVCLRSCRASRCGDRLFEWLGVSLDDGAQRQQVCGRQRPSVVLCPDGHVSLCRSQPERATRKEQNEAEQR